MKSQKLITAREYEAEKDWEIPAEERPLFHLSSRCGWMNDPNGFSVYGGIYHLFYQYYPYAPVWGPMHWGHAVSRDLLTWQYMPAALAPDTPADCDGCFSGSAVTLADGRHMLMYTGVMPAGNGSGRQLQVQCLAFGDGNEYEKHDGNPVLAATDLPEGLSCYDFRDPKVFRRADGTYGCVACGCTADRDARILLFRSDNGLDWHFESILAANHHRFGTIWECPDFFLLDGKAVLLCSPMDMQKTGKYSGGKGTLCLIGDYDRENCVLMNEQDQPVDEGIDFYATQTLLTPDGRRIMTAWMANWDNLQNNAEGLRWFGQMILPRELAVRNGRLCQQPVRELLAYRHDRHAYKDVPVSQKTELNGIRGRSMDVTLAVRPGDGGYRSFEIRLAEDETFHTSFVYDRDRQEITADRSCSGAETTVLHRKSFRTAEYNNELKLRLVLDRYSVELFVNDGEQTFTMTIGTDLGAEGISFRADRNAVMDIESFTLRKPA